LARVRVKLLSPLRRFAQDKGEIEADGRAVREVLMRIAEAYPALWGQLFDSSNSLRDFMNVFLNQENIRDLEGLETTVSTGDSIIIVPAIAGGGPKNV
jgi:adenylyltransferase/sulfurtransferase